MEGPVASPLEGPVQGRLEGPLESLQEGPQESPNAPGNAIGMPPAATVHVGGDVRRPGAYAWFPGMTVRQLVSAAGGLAPDATDQLEIVREGTDQRAEAKRILDDLVEAGDSIVLR